MNELLRGESSRDGQIRMAQTKLLERGLLYADQYVNRQYMVGLPMYEVQGSEIRNYNNMRLFKLDKLVYDANEDLNDKLVSLYGALNSIHSTAILVFVSNANGVELYLGTRCEGHASTAGNILEAGIKGNFGGSEYTALHASEIQKLFGDRINSTNRQCVSTVTLVPSLRDDEKANTVQGLEKLLDAMAGKEFMAILIAEPMHQADIEVQKRGLEELYSTISPYAETSLAYGHNASYAVADGTFSSFSDSINNSITNSTSESQSHSSTSGTSSSDGYSFSGDGASFSGSSGSSYSETYSSSSSWSRAVTSGETKTTSAGVNQTITNTTGESRTLTIKHVNKSVNEMMKYIDSMLERVHACESFGLWSTAAYFVSEDVQVSAMAASTFRALVAGDESYLDKALINIWDQANPRAKLILDTILRGTHPRINVPRMNEFNAQTVKPTVLVSGKELPIFMSFPRKSLPGLLVDYMASFGRSVYNPYDNPKNEKIKLGCIRHKGVVNDNLPVRLDVEELRSHCFITGSTGSGKSNTTYHLINEMILLGKRFLVIEPAKGEYKYAFGALKGINIYWTNPKMFKLLRLNPFSFPEGIHVLEHLDRFIEILSVCWPLYSAMPAILKAAIERAYISCGWDLVNSIHIENGRSLFPDFNDLLRELPRVINESSYSADAKGDYTGALVTRVSSLTNGIMGSIFCSGDELSNEQLFDDNTIVDLSRVGSSETKAMLMGVLIMKLNEHRMSAGSGMNAHLKHVTIIEEAHNLLRRIEGGASELASKSVEMLSNSIAEMRTYGEGFIIVDQSPTSVDISAIKNTNTKIVMRLPEQADFEAVGGSFGLSPEQIREIVRLPRGTAIVSQSGWLEPVMTAVDRANNAYELKSDSAEPIVKDDSIIRYINSVLQQIDNEVFVELLPIKQRLRSSSIPVNRQEQLIKAYRNFLEDCKGQGHSKNFVVEKAQFVVTCVGCSGLAKVFKPKISTDGKVYTREQQKVWYNEIKRGLDFYGDYGTDEDKMRIAKLLFVYMANCMRDDYYKKCLDIAEI